MNKTQRIVKRMRGILKSLISPALFRKTVAVTVAACFLMNIGGVAAYAVDPLTRDELIKKTQENKQSVNVLNTGYSKTPSQSVITIQNGVVMQGQTKIGVVEYDKNKKVATVILTGGNDQASLIMHGAQAQTWVEGVQKQTEALLGIKNKKAEGKDKPKDAVRTPETKLESSNQQSQVQQPKTSDNKQTTPASDSTWNKDDQHKPQQQNIGTNNQGVQEQKGPQLTDTQKANGKKLDPQSVSFTNMKVIQQEAVKSNVTLIAQKIENIDVAQVLHDNGGKPLIVQLENTSGDGNANIFAVAYLKGGQVYLQYPKDGEAQEIALKKMNDEANLPGYRLSGKMLKSPAAGEKENITDEEKSQTTGAYARELLSDQVSTYGRSENIVDSVYLTSSLKDQLLSGMLGKFDAIDKNESLTDTQKASQKATLLASWGVKTDVVGISNEQLSALAVQAADNVYAYLVKQGDNVFNCAIESLSAVFSLGNKGYDKKKLAADAIMADVLEGNLDITSDAPMQLSMFAMQQAAAKNGVDLSGYVISNGQMNFDTLATMVADGQPVIAHMDQGNGVGHFVVVTSDGNGGLKITDPLKPNASQKELLAEFKAKWTGNILASDSAVDEKALADNKIQKLEIGGTLQKPGLMDIKGAGWLDDAWSWTKTNILGVKDVSYKETVSDSSGKKVDVEVTGTSYLWGLYNTQKTTVTTTQTNKDTGKEESSVESKDDWTLFNGDLRKVGQDNSTATVNNVTIKKDTVSNAQGSVATTQITVQRPSTENSTVATTKVMTVTGQDPKVISSSINYVRLTATVDTSFGAQIKNAIVNAQKLSANRPQAYSNFEAAYNNASQLTTEPNSKVIEHTGNTTIVSYASAQAIPIPIGDGSNTLNIGKIEFYGTDEFNMIKTIKDTQGNILYDAESSRPQVLTYSENGFYVDHFVTKDAKEVLERTYVDINGSDKNISVDIKKTNIGYTSVDDMVTMYGDGYDNIAQQIKSGEWMGYDWSYTVIDNKGVYTNAYISDGVFENTGSVTTSISDDGTVSTSGIIKLGTTSDGKINIAYIDNSADSSGAPTTRRINGVIESDQWAKGDLSDWQGPNKIVIGAGSYELDSEKNLKELSGTIENIQYAKDSRQMSSFTLNGYTETSTNADGSKNRTVYNGLVTREFYTSGDSKGSLSSVSYNDVKVQVYSQKAGNSEWTVKSDDQVTYLINYKETMYAVAGDSQYYTKDELKKKYGDLEKLLKSDEWKNKIWSVTDCDTIGYNETGNIAAAGYDSTVKASETNEGAHTVVKTNLTTGAQEIDETIGTTTAKLTDTVTNEVIKVTVTDGQEKQTTVNPNGSSKVESYTGATTETTYFRNGVKLDEPVIVKQSATVETTIVAQDKSSWTEKITLNQTQTQGDTAVIISNNYEYTQRNSDGQIVSKTSGYDYENTSDVNTVTEVGSSKTEESYTYNTDGTVSRNFTTTDTDLKNGVETVEKGIETGTFENEQAVDTQVVSTTTKYALTINNDGTIASRSQTEYTPSMKKFENGKLAWTGIIEAVTAKNDKGESVTEYRIRTTAYMADNYKPAEVTGSLPASDVKGSEVTNTVNQTWSLSEDEYTTLISGFNGKTTAEQSAAWGNLTNSATQKPGTLAQNEWVREIKTAVTYDEKNRVTSYNYTKSYVDYLSKDTQPHTVAGACTTSYTEADVATPGYLQSVSAVPAVGQQAVTVSDVQVIAGTKKLINTSQATVNMVSSIDGVANTEGASGYVAPKVVSAGTYTYSHTPAKIITPSMIKIDLAAVSIIDKATSVLPGYVSPDASFWGTVKKVAGIAAFVAGLVLLPFGGWLLIAGAVIILAASVAVGYATYRMTGDVQQAIGEGVLTAVVNAIPGVGGLVGKGISRAAVAIGKTIAGVSTASKVAAFAARTAFTIGADAIVGGCIYTTCYVAQVALTGQDASGNAKSLSDITLSDLSGEFLNGAKTAAFWSGGARILGGVLKGLGMMGTRFASGSTNLSLSLEMAGQQSAGKTNILGTILKPLTAFSNAEQSGVLSQKLQNWASSRKTLPGRFFAGIANLPNTMLGNIAGNVINISKAAEQMMTIKGISGMLASAPLFTALEVGFSSFMSVFTGNPAITWNGKDENMGLLEALAYKFAEDMISFTRMGVVLPGQMGVFQARMGQTAAETTLGKIGQATFSEHSISNLFRSVGSLIRSGFSRGEGTLSGRLSMTAEQIAAESELRAATRSVLEAEKLAVQAEKVASRARFLKKSTQATADKNAQLLADAKMALAETESGAARILGAERTSQVVSNVTKWESNQALKALSSFNSPGFVSLTLYSGEQIGNAIASILPDSMLSGINNLFAKLNSIDNKLLGIPETGETSGMTEKEKFAQNFSYYFLFFIPAARAGNRVQLTNVVSENGKVYRDLKGKTLDGTVTRDALLKDVEPLVSATLPMNLRYRSMDVGEFLDIMATERISGKDGTAQHNYLKGVVSADEISTELYDRISVSEKAKYARYMEGERSVYRNQEAVSSIKAEFGDVSITPLVEVARNQISSAELRAARLLAAKQEQKFKNELSSDLRGDAATLELIKQLDQYEASIGLTAMERIAVIERADALFSKVAGKEYSESWFSAMKDLAHSGSRFRVDTMLQEWKTTRDVLLKQQTSATDAVEQSMADAKVKLYDAMISVIEGANQSGRYDALADAGIEKLPTEKRVAAAVEVLNDLVRSAVRQQIDAEQVRVNKIMGTIKNNSADIAYADSILKTNVKELKSLKNGTLDTLISRVFIDRAGTLEKILEVSASVRSEASNGNAASKQMSLLLDTLKSSPQDRSLCQQQTKAFIDTLMDTNSGAWTKLTKAVDRVLGDQAIRAREMEKLFSNDLEITYATRQELITEAFGPGKTEAGLSIVEKLALDLKIGELVLEKYGNLAKDRNGNSISMIDYKKLENEGKNCLALNQIQMLMNNMLGRISALETAGGKTFTFAWSMSLYFHIMKEKGVAEFLAAKSGDAAQFVIGKNKDLTNALGLETVAAQTYYKDQKYDELAKEYTRSIADHVSGRVISYDLQTRGFVELQARVGKDGTNLNEALNQVRFRVADEADVAALSRVAFVLGSGDNLASKEFVSHIDGLIDSLFSGKIVTVHENSSDVLSDATALSFTMNDGKVEYSSALKKEIDQYKAQHGYSKNEVDAQIDNIFRAYSVLDGSSKNKETIAWVDGNPATVENGIRRSNTTDQSATYNVALVSLKIREIESIYGKGSLKAVEEINALKLDKNKVKLSQSIGESTISQIFSRGQGTVLNCGGSATLDVAMEIAHTIFGGQAVEVQGSTIKGVASRDGGTHLKLEYRTREDIVKETTNVAVKYLTERAIAERYMKEHGLESLTAAQMSELGLTLKVNTGKNIIGEVFGASDASYLRDILVSTLRELISRDAGLKAKSITTDQTAIKKAMQEASDRFDSILEKQKGKTLKEQMEALNREFGSSMEQYTEHVQIIDAKLAEEKPEDVSAMAGNKAGKLTLTNESALRGIDFQSIDIRILDAQNFSKGDLLQAIGRGGRNTAEYADFKQYVYLDEIAVSADISKARTMSDFLEARGRHLFKDSGLVKNLGETLDVTQVADQLKLLELSSEFKSQRMKSESILFKAQNEASYILYKEPVAELIATARKNGNTADADFLESSYRKIIEHAESKLRSELSRQKDGLIDPDKVMEDIFNGIVEQSRQTLNEVAQGLKDASLKKEIELRLLDLATVDFASLREQIRQNETVFDDVTFAGATRVMNGKTSPSETVAKVLLRLGRQVLPGEGGTTAKPVTVELAREKIKAAKIDVNLDKVLESASYTSAVNRETVLTLKGERFLNAILAIAQPQVNGQDTSKQDAAVQRATLYAFAAAANISISSDNDDQNAVSIAEYARDNDLTVEQMSTIGAALANGTVSQDVVAKIRSASYPLGFAETALKMKSALVLPAAWQIELMRQTILNATDKNAADIVMVTKVVEAYDTAVSRFNDLKADQKNLIAKLKLRLALSTLDKACNFTAADLLNALSEGQDTSGTLAAVATGLTGSDITTIRAAASTGKLDSMLKRISARQLSGFAYQSAEKRDAILDKALHPLSTSGVVKTLMGVVGVSAGVQGSKELITELVDRGVDMTMAFQLVSSALAAKVAAAQQEVSDQRGNEGTFTTADTVDDVVASLEHTVSGSFGSIRELEAISQLRSGSLSNTSEGKLVELTQNKKLPQVERQKALNLLALAAQDPADGTVAIQKLGVIAALKVNGAPAAEMKDTDAVSDADKDTIAIAQYAQTKLSAVMSELLKDDASTQIKDKWQHIANIALAVVIPTALLLHAPMAVVIGAGIVGSLIANRGKAKQAKGAGAATEQMKTLKQSFGKMLIPTIIGLAVWPLTGVNPMVTTPVVTGILSGFTVGSQLKKQRTATASREGLESRLAKIEAILSAYPDAMQGVTAENVANFRANLADTSLFKSKRNWDKLSLNMLVTQLKNGSSAEMIPQISFATPELKKVARELNKIVASRTKTATAPSAADKEQEKQMIERYTKQFGLSEADARATLKDAANKNATKQALSSLTIADLTAAAAAAGLPDATLAALAYNLGLSRADAQEIISGYDANRQAFEAVLANNGMGAEEAAQETARVLEKVRPAKSQMTTLMADIKALGTLPELSPEQLDNLVDTYGFADENAWLDTLAQSLQALRGADTASLSDAAKTVAANKATIIKGLAKIWGVSEDEALAKIDTLSAVMPGLFFNPAAGLQGVRERLSGERYEQLKDARVASWLITGLAGFNTPMQGMKTNKPEHVLSFMTQMAERDLSAVREQVNALVSKVAGDPLAEALYSQAMTNTEKTGDMYVRLFDTLVKTAKASAVPAQQQPATVAAPAVKITNMSASEISAAVDEGMKQVQEWLNTFAAATGSKRAAMAAELGLSPFADTGKIAEASVALGEMIEKRTLNNAIVNCAIQSLETITGELGELGVKLTPSALTGMIRDAYVADILLNELSVSSLGMNEATPQLSTDAIIAAAKGQGIALASMKLTDGIETLGQLSGIDANNKVIAHFERAPGEGHFISITQVKDGMVSYFDNMAESVLTTVALADIEKTVGGTFSGTIVTTLGVVAANEAVMAPEYGDHAIAAGGRAKGGMALMPEKPMTISVDAQKTKQEDVFGVTRVESNEEFVAAVRAVLYNGSENEIVAMFNDLSKKFGIEPMQTVNGKASTDAVQAQFAQLYGALKEMAGNEKAGAQTRQECSDAARIVAVAANILVNPVARERFNQLSGRSEVSVQQIADMSAVVKKDYIRITTALMAGKINDIALSKTAIAAEDEVIDVAALRDAVAVKRSLISRLTETVRARLSGERTLEDRFRDVLANDGFNMDGNIVRSKVGRINLLSTIAVTQSA